MCSLKYIEIIILNLFLLKFAAFSIAASQPGAVRNQMYFTKVPGQGKYLILPKKVKAFLTAPLYVREKEEIRADCQLRYYIIANRLIIGLD